MIGTTLSGRAMPHPAENYPSPPVGIVRDKTEELQNLGSWLAKMTSRAGELADRMVGSIPAAPEKTTEAAGYSGDVGGLDCAISSLRHTLNRLEENLGRLEVL